MEPDLTAIPPDQSHHGPQAGTDAVPMDPSVPATDVPTNQNSTSTASASNSSVVTRETLKKGRKAGLKLRNKELELALEQAKKYIEDLKKRVLNMEELNTKKKQKKELDRTFYEEPFFISFPDDEKAYLSSKEKLHTTNPQPHFFRAFHEGSATLSCYMTKNCWPSVHPKYKDDAAFQSLGEFLPVRDWTYERVVRHFDGIRKRPTTSYVSVFDKYAKVERKAEFLYKESACNARRISIARISTVGLVPAFFETTEILPHDPDHKISGKGADVNKDMAESTPTMEPSNTSFVEPQEVEAVVSKSNVTLGKSTEHLVDSEADKVNVVVASTPSTQPTPTSTTTDASQPAKSSSDQRKAERKITVHVKIPIWVRNTAVPQDRSNITLQQLEESGADTWISVLDNRGSGLELPSDPNPRKGGEPEEWLAGGIIPDSFVTDVWPYDGETIHKVKGEEVVTSADNQDWQFDWESSIWRSRTEMSQIKEALQREEEKKRKSADDHDDVSTPEKRRRLNGDSLHQA